MTRGVGYPDETAEARYRTTNWPQNNLSLKARGDLTVWFAPDIAWHGNCRVSLDTVPLRSWPLFRARDVLNELLHSVRNPQATTGS